MEAKRLSVQRGGGTMGGKAVCEHRHGLSWKEIKFLSSSAGWFLQLCVGMNLQRPSSSDQEHSDMFSDV